MTAVAIIQFILNFLGFASLLLGVIALIFGNHNRAGALIGSGIIFLLIKYGIGFLFLGAKHAKGKNEQQEALNVLDKMMATKNPDEGKRILREWSDKNPK